MSLSGNLGFVSLDEVLRLLTRSNQQGSVDVRGEEIHGRIFVTRGGIALATTIDDAGMRRHLVKAGLIEESYFDDSQPASPLSAFDQASGGAVVDLLREMTVESIYQLGIQGDSFEVAEGQESPYASPSPFDLESVLADAKQRLTDWAEVSRTVKDLGAVIRFARDLGDRDRVELDNDEWRVLSEIGAGSSVTHIAEELGTTEFWTARVAARLIDKELIGFEATEAVEAEPKYTWNESQPAVDESVNPDQSWWEEPSPAESTEADAEPFDEVIEAQDHRDYEAADAEATDHDSAPAAVQDDEPAYSEQSDVEDVEEDTETFLEKVFSELDSSSDDEDAGYGLLRRRRMGALRDVGGE